jgi:hypothetical protein
MVQSAGDRELPIRGRDSPFAPLHMPHAELAARVQAVPEDRPSGPRWPLPTIVLSCLGAATAAWLLPASVHIVGWSRADGVKRVALVAPLQTIWVPLLLGGALALLLVALPPRTPDGLARRAHLVAPLSLLWVWAAPFVPWLADRAPLLVALAGPGRWLVLAAALAGTIGRFRAGWRPPTVPGRRTVFVVSLALFVALGLRSMSAVGVKGDEPHYLVITHSLLADGDIAIENNHLAGDYRSFHPADLPPDYLVRGRDLAIYSIHAPGLPVLLVPGYAAFGAAGAVATMALLAALAALALFDVAARIGGRRIGWATWALTACTVPFVPHAWAIYPEMAATAIVAWSVRWMLFEPPAAAGAWVVRGAALAVLPWLHTKFVVLLAGLALALAARVWRRPRQLVAFGAPIVVLAVCWLAFFRIVYGTFDPQAPYGYSAAEFVRLENLPRSLLGALFDQKFGLIVYAPIYLMTGYGAWRLAGQPVGRLIVLTSLGVAAAFAAGSMRYYMWWGGESAPARFLVPLVPILAFLLAGALAHVEALALRTAAILLAAVSAAVAATGVAGVREGLLLSDPHGVSRLIEWIQDGAPWTAALPIFTERDWQTPLRRLVPWIAAAVAAALGGQLAVRLGCRSRLWGGAVQASVFVLAGALLGPPLAGEARANAVRRGRLALADRYDPERLRAIDLSAFSPMPAADWIAATPVTYDGAAAATPDAPGRLIGPIALAPGDYTIRLWWLGERTRASDAIVAAGEGRILARVAGPLPNPTEIDLRLPVRVPQLLLQVSRPEEAQAMRRVEIVPRALVPVPERPALDVRAIEQITGRPHAFAVYVNDAIYPEGGVFWTRSTDAGEVVVFPAGAPELRLTLHAAAAATMQVTVDGRTRSVAMQASETRVVAVPVEAGRPFVRLSVQASKAIRPADLDPASTDRRLLGCYVKIEAP